MAESDYTTYRVQGLPPDIDADEAEQILEEFFDSDGLSTKPKVHSLGLNPFSFGCNITRVATVTFANTPETLRDGNRWGPNKRVSVKGITTDIRLEIDTTFLGFTPLNLVEDDGDHKIDCILVSGLSSHPFGSWKQRGGSFMWLRDDAAWRSPNVRTFLYGYDTSLVGSESFQDIDDIGRKLGDFITRVRKHRVVEPRPIVFIAHSLGGLVVKEAICHLAETDEINARCVYGLVFFGVPNRGLCISYWLPIVDNQPNESLIRNLAPGSHYLRNLHHRFSSVFRFPTSRVISVYETLKSKTAKEENPGQWRLTGKTEVLVTRDSALDSCPSGLVHTNMSMNQNHADLPKFRSPHDHDYQLLIMHLNELWREAVHDVEMRFGSEGFFSRNSQTSDEQFHASDQRRARARTVPYIERARTPEPHPRKNATSSTSPQVHGFHFNGTISGRDVFAGMNTSGGTVNLKFS